MSRLAPLGVVFLAAAVVFAAETRETADTKKIDPAKLVGEWNYVGGWAAGKEAPKDKLHSPVKIDKDTFTLHGEKDAKFVISYKIVDDTKEPAPIDMEITSGPDGSKGVKALGIIWSDGKKMELAYVVEDGKNKRPTKMESTKENNAFYFKLEKK